MSELFRFQSNELVLSDLRSGWGRRIIQFEFKDRDEFQFKIIHSTEIPSGNSFSFSSKKTMPSRPWIPGITQKNWLSAKRYRNVLWSIKYFKIFYRARWFRRGPWIQIPKFFVLDQMFSRSKRVHSIKTSIIRSCGWLILVCENKVRSDAPGSRIFPL